MTFDDRHKAEARAQVEALAKEFGFSLAELINTNSKTRRTYVAPKYQHPENLSLTWSGRGRKPQWFNQALASGKKHEELAVAGQQRHVCGPRISPIITMT